MTSPLIHARSAVWGYRQRRVVEANDLSISPGARIGVFGANGSGKSTLLHGLIGLLAPMSGMVSRSADLRIGYLSQYRSVDASWPMSGFDAAAIMRSAQSRCGWISRNDRAEILASMRELGVESLAGGAFSRMSGGQQQRILIAGALAAKPSVLILDEPTDGLDAKSRSSFLELLQSLASRGMAIVLVSHEVADLNACCESVAWVRIAEVATEPSRIEIIQPRELAYRLAEGAA